jgi:hypothetical protein
MVGVGSGGGNERRGDGGRGGGGQGGHSGFSQDVIHNDERMPWQDRVQGTHTHTHSHTHAHTH